MLERFYLRIENWRNNRKRRKRIKELEKEQIDLSWASGVEKNDDPEIERKFIKNEKELQELKMITW